MPIIHPSIHPGLLLPPHYRILIITVQRIQFPTSFSITSSSFLSLSYRSYRSIHSRSHTIVCHAICFIYLEFWPRICVWCIDMRCVYFVIYRYFMFTVKFGIFFRLLIISTSELPDISSLIHHMELIKLNIWDYWVVCA